MDKDQLVCCSFLPTTCFRLSPIYFSYQIRLRKSPLIYRLRVVALLHVGDRIRGAIGAENNLVLRVAARYNHADNLLLSELLLHEGPLQSGASHRCTSVASIRGLPMIWASPEGPPIGRLRMTACPADRTPPDGRLPPPIGRLRMLREVPRDADGALAPPDQTTSTPTRAHANAKRRPRRVAFRFWHRSEKPTEGNRG